jgi:hypothetical protein
MKEQTNEHTIHTNEHKMYPGKPEMGENLANVVFSMSKVKHEVNSIFRN